MYVYRHTNNLLQTFENCTWNANNTYCTTWDTFEWEHAFDSPGMISKSFMFREGCRLHSRDENSRKTKSNTLKGQKLGYFDQHRIAIWYTVTNFKVNRYNLSFGRLTGYVSHRYQRCPHTKSTLPTFRRSSLALTAAEYRTVWAERRNVSDGKHTCFNVCTL